MTRIVHLTDPHTTSLKGIGVMPLLGKRALGYLSWRRKRQYRHTQEMLEATTTAALAHQPDALVLTGDLLHIGLRQEMQQIRPWLKALATKLPVLLVPGNHDYYAPNSLQLWKDELGDLPVFGDAASTHSEWPRVLQLGDLRVIGLCTAYPAPLTKADGQLGSQQRTLLANLLTTQGSKKVGATLVALHHPAKAALSEARKSLLDVEELGALLAPASALVHGHLHENISYHVNGVACYCTASASSVHEEALASYRLLDFSGAEHSSRLFIAQRGETEAQFLEVTEDKREG